MKLLESQEKQRNIGCELLPSGDKEELAVRNHPCLNSRQDNNPWVAFRSAVPGALGVC